jgi:type VII secretion system (Wss) protein YukD
MDVRVVDATRSRSEDVTVPGDVAVGRFTGRLVQLLGEPPAQPDGTPIAYRLQHVRAATQIDDDETLEAAGVVDEDVLVLAAVSAPPLPPPPPPPPADRGPRRGALVAVAAAVVVVGGGIAAYLAVSGEEERAVSVRVPRLTVTAPPAALPEEEPGPLEAPAAEREADAARDIQDVIEFSLAGRTAVRDGDYAEAVANRRSVLRRLDAIEGVTGRGADARRTLRRAMRSSLASDIAYRDGGDASASDAEATRLKRIFVRQWTPIAEAHDLRIYREGDF